MEVKLKRTFFVDGIQYRKGQNAIPEKYRDHLPSSAEVLDEEEVKAVAKAAAKKKRDVEPAKSLAEIGEEMGLADASVKLE